MSDLSPRPMNNAQSGQKKGENFGFSNENGRVGVDFVT